MYLYLVTLFYSKICVDVWHAPVHLFCVPIVLFSICDPTVLPSVVFLCSFCDPTMLSSVFLLWSYCGPSVILLWYLLCFFWDPTVALLCSLWSYCASVALMCSFCDPTVLMCSFWGPSLVLSTATHLWYIEWKRRWINYIEIWAQILKKNTLYSAAVVGLGSLNRIWITDVQ